MSTFKAKYDVEVTEIEVRVIGESKRSEARLCA